METYKKYIVEEQKMHIMQYVRIIEGLSTHMKKLEDDLNKDGYKESKQLSKINKSFDKFKSKFINTYFSR